MINKPNKLFNLQKFSKFRQRAEEYLSKTKEINKITKSTVESLQLLHELQVHQLELELQNQALQESRSELEIALAHYKDLYDSALTGYFTFDYMGRIIQTNLMGAYLLPTSYFTHGE